MLIIDGGGGGGSTYRNFPHVIAGNWILGDQQAAGGFSDQSAVSVSNLLAVDRWRAVRGGTSFSEHTSGVTGQHRPPSFVAVGDENNPLFPEMFPLLRR